MTSPMLLAQHRLPPFFLWKLNSFFNKISNDQDWDMGQAVCIGNWGFHNIQERQVKILVNEVKNSLFPHN